MPTTAGDGSRPVACEARGAVGHEPIFVGIVATFFYGEVDVVDCYDVIEVGTAVLTAATTTCGRSGARNDESMSFGDDLNRFDMRDVKMAAKDEIDPQFTREIEGFSGVLSDVVRPERLDLGEMMVDHQHLEVVDRHLSKKRLHRGAFASSDASALDGAAVR